MVVYIQHDKNNYFELILNDTTVARKWLYVFMVNLRNESLYTYLNKTCKYTKLQKILSESERVHNIKVINESIEEVNKSIKGDKFPYQAYDGMDWEHSQKIHRAFTTSQLTQKSFKYRISERKLRDIKNLTGVELEDQAPQFVNKTFDIIDQDKFYLHSCKINHYIHSNERTIPSQRSDDMFELYGKNNWLYYNWITEDQKLKDAGIASLDRRYIIFTKQDIEESANDPNWLEYDVFAASDIYGKPYLETFLEYDSPLELDVKNNSSNSGGFCIIDGPHYNRKKLFNNSVFSEWCDSYDLSRAITHPIPIGKIGNLVYEGKNVDRQFASDFSYLFTNKKKPIQVEFKYHLKEPIGLNYKY